MNEEIPYKFEKLEERHIKKSSIINPEDLYIRGYVVYKVVTFNETDKMVLFATTNDEIQNFGSTRVKDMKRLGLHLCPVQLLEPAAQVFELEGKLTESSLKSLRKYRISNVKLYDQLGLDYIMGDITRSLHRIFIPPEIQVEQFPELKGKVFEILVPFYCLTKQEYKQRMFKSGHKSLQAHYNRGMKHSNWPVFYVSPRFT